MSSKATLLFIAGHAFALAGCGTTVLGVGNGGDGGGGQGGGTSGGAGGGGDCPTLGCDPFCPAGVTTDANGCPTCECAPSVCGDSPPVGCLQTGCPNGEICDTSVGCNVSTCDCDEESETWICSEDCGGGTCVPDPGACNTPNPAGCIQTGCDAGFICDTSYGCFSTSCTCDPETRSWGCDDDCSGGFCVPNTACGPNPQGCIDTGCPDGFTCDVGVECIPSQCDCDEGTGEFGCTDDCGGGQCVPVNG